MLSVSGVELTTPAETYKCSETKHQADKVTHSWPVFFWTGEVIVDLALEISNALLGQPC